MSRAERLAGRITTHSKTILVVLLVVTALLAVGATAVDDDTSLEQFESDSEAAQAAEYVDDRFGAAAEANTTSVQVITRGENVLSQESLLASLEFQQSLHENESIEATLADDDPITGVENVVAITAIADERAADLEERGAELEARSQELNETSERLEAGVDAVRERERERAELEAAADAGAIEDETYEAAAADLEAEIDAEIDAALEESPTELDDEQRATYVETVEEIRDLEASLVELELAADAGAIPQEEYESQTDDLEEGIEGLTLAATDGLLEDEYDALEADSEALEDDQTDLEEGIDPTLDEQIEALEELDETAFEETLVDVLSVDDEDDEAAEDADDEATGDADDEEETGDDGAETDDTAGGDGEEADGAGALELMPTDYDPGTTEADARMTVVTQTVDDDGAGMEVVDEQVQASQLDLQTIATDHENDHVVFGAGILTDEIDRSMADSLAIVGPLALLFVVAALLVAYRDPLDIVLGVTGIGVVLVWTFGFMGWTGIAFNQMMVAIPVLLIGLSIDYAIHVFMRHREQREADRITGTVGGSMAVALAGVGVALVWVTATTAFGFLANLISPIAPIREFGIVAAVGILSALVVFGALIPASKVEIDEFLEARGYDRRKRAFGTGRGRLSDALSVGAVAARRAPLVVVLLVVLVTAGGVYGATQVDTSFEEEDFLAEQPPEWTQSLPDPVAPGEYQTKASLEFVDERFQRQDAQAQLLVRGDVTDDETLVRVDETRDAAAESDVAFTLPTGEADVEDPLTTMESVAATNETFAGTFEEADTTGDGIPDEDLAEVYDALFDVDEEAASEVLSRADDGEYEAIRLVVAVDGDADFEDVTDEMRALAADFENGTVANGGDANANGTEDANESATAAQGGSGWEAIATGDPVVNHVVEQDLLETVLQSLLVALVAVFVFLTLAYWATGNGATLGAVTLLPVALSVSWILGTMYLIGMPFNVLTGMITSLTIGLGVAYSIHVSARYTLELERQGDVWAAMETTVTGTGGALLGSAATTVGGFGTLALAIFPALSQFGIITGLTIVYAFLASVIVLPTFLVLWTRYAGPDVPFEFGPLETGSPAASDGGTVAVDDAEPSRKRGDGSSAGESRDDDRTDESSDDGESRGDDA